MNSYKLFTETGSYSYRSTELMTALSAFVRYSRKGTCRLWSVKNGELHKVILQSEDNKAEFVNG